MRVGIISLVHESNTFAVTPTTIELFRRDSLLLGEAVRSEFEPTFKKIESHPWTQLSSHSDPSERALPSSRSLTKWALTLSRAISHKRRSSPSYRRVTIASGQRSPARNAATI